MVRIRLRRFLWDWATLDPFRFALKDPSFKQLCPVCFIDLRIGAPCDLCGVEVHYACFYTSTTEPGEIHPRTHGVCVTCARPD